MCHVALMLPLLALPVLWMWPLAVSVPVYVVVAIVSAAIRQVANLHKMKLAVEAGEWERMSTAIGRVMKLA